MKYFNKLLIVDGSYVLHRSLKTPALAELTTKSGMKTGGVFGALRIIQSELKKFPDYFPIFCFDAGLSSRRTTLYPNYKSNRKRQEADRLVAVGEAVEEDYLAEYRRQRSDLIEILKSLGIPSLLISGWEGDDLQYILTNMCNECVVISDDKDMIQLVSPTTKIRRAMRDELIEWDENDTFYHHPRFTIRKSIIGDQSDGIPKCGPGLGDKTADKIALILENVDVINYKSTLKKYCEDNPKDSIVKKINVLLENWNQFNINYQLINLRLVETPPGFENLIKDRIISQAGKANVLTAYAGLGKYELNTIFPDSIITIIKNLSSTLLVNEVK